MEMRFFSSRKAGIALSLKQIIGFVMAVAIILATVGLFIGLMNIFMGPPEDGSVKTFEKAFAAIEALYDERNKNTSCVLTASYLESDWAIVGFNADGIKGADEDDLVCKMGGWCIEEMCGRVDDTLNKPKACGHGPCLCLCDGGNGDIDDDDCTESKAICKKFSPNIGFDVMYFVEKDNTECQYSRNQYPVPGSSDMDSLCDLVYAGHDCAQNYGQGRPRAADFDLFILKDSARTASSRTKNAVVFDIIWADDRKKINYYPDTKVDCITMVEDLKELKIAPPPKPTEETGPVDARLQQDLDRQRQQGGTIGVSRGGQ
jgi:hypothetical protein